MGSNMVWYGTCFSVAVSSSFEVVNAYHISLALQQSLAALVTRITNAFFALCAALQPLLVCCLKYTSAVV